MQSGIGVDLKHDRSFDCIKTEQALLPLLLESLREDCELAVLLLTLLLCIIDSLLLADEQAAAPPLQRRLVALASEAEALSGPFSRSPLSHFGKKSAALSFSTKLKAFLKVKALDFFEPHHFALETARFSLRYSAGPTCTPLGTLLGNGIPCRGVDVSIYTGQGLYFWCSSAARRETQA